MVRVSKAPLLTYQENFNESPLGVPFKPKIGKKDGFGMKPNRFSLKGNQTIQTVLT
jgi:hypothetical protein